MQNENNFSWLKKYDEILNDLAQDTPKYQLTNKEIHKLLWLQYNTIYQIINNIDDWNNLDRGYIDLYLDKELSDSEEEYNAIFGEPNLDKDVKLAVSLLRKKGFERIATSIENMASELKKEKESNKITIPNKEELQKLIEKKS